MMNNSNISFICFDPTVWGTVSDWIVAMATIFSLFFLIMTLRSQISVQKMQIKLLNIENARFLKDQNLSVQIDILSFKPYKLGEESFLVIFELRIRVQNASFKKLTLDFDKDVILGVDQPKDFDFLYDGDVIDYKFSHEMPYQQYLDQETVIQLQLDVVDYAENRLRKTVLLTCKNGGYSITDRDNGFEKIND